MATVDHLRQTTGALRNLESFVAQQIAREAKSELENTLFQGLFQTHEPTRNRAMEHYRKQLTDLATQQVADIRRQMGEAREAAARKVERAEREWEGTRDLAKYQYYRDVAAAQASSVRSVAEFRKLIDKAGSREEIEALMLHGVPELDKIAQQPGSFAGGDLRARTEIQGLRSQLERKLDEHRPLLLDAYAQAERASAEYSATVAALRAANDEAGGVLDVALGLSIFSPADDMSEAVPAPAGLFG